MNKYIELTLALCLLGLIVLGLYSLVEYVKPKIESHYKSNSTYPNIPGTNYTCTAPMEKYGQLYCNIEDIKEVQT